MGGCRTECESTYRLVAGPRGDAPERFVEFRALRKEAVFIVAAKAFPNQDTDVYSDGRALCRLFTPAAGTYWVISPPRSSRPAPC